MPGGNPPKKYLGRSKPFGKVSDCIILCLAYLMGFNNEDRDVDSSNLSWTLYLVGPLWRSSKPATVQVAVRKVWLCYGHVLDLNSTLLMSYHECAAASPNSRCPRLLPTLLNITICSVQWCESEVCPAAFLVFCQHSFVACGSLVLAWDKLSTSWYATMKPRWDEHIHEIMMWWTFNLCNLLASSWPPLGWVRRRGRKVQTWLWVYVLWNTTFRKVTCYIHTSNF